MGVSLLLGISEGWFLRVCGVRADTGPHQTIYYFICLRHSRRATFCALACSLSLSSPTTQRLPSTIAKQAKKPAVTCNNKGFEPIKTTDPPLGCKSCSTILAKWLENRNQSRVSFLQRVRFMLVSSMHRRLNLSNNLDHVNQYRCFN